MTKYTSVGSITNEEAAAIDSLFTNAVTSKRAYELDYRVYGSSCNDKLKKGTMVLAHFNDYNGSEYFCICKVTSIKMNFLGENDVRISNGQYSWRAENVCIL